MKKLLTLLICVVALGAGALLGFWLSGGDPLAARSAPETTATNAAEIVVYKSASCGCCGDWVTHMRDHGFTVTVHDSENMDRIKREAGVPRNLWSCHTAFAGDYVIEGHVPAAEVQRLLVEQPVAAGLAVPGMPLGSPGMEVDDRRDAYAVVLFQEDGEVAAFAHYLGGERRDSRPGGTP